MTQTNVVFTSKEINDGFVREVIDVSELKSHHDGGGFGCLSCDGMVYGHLACRVEPIRESSVRRWPHIRMDANRTEV